MPYLYALNGRHRHQVFPLDDGPEGSVLGQADDAGVHLADPWISWTHARVRRDGAFTTIEDLGSTNGTYVNCERVTRHTLSDDDVVFLGRTHLLFVATDRTPSPPPRHAERGPLQPVLLGLEALPGPGGPGAPTPIVPGRGESTRRLRMSSKGAAQRLSALDASHESALSDSGPKAAAGARGAAAFEGTPETGRVRGPFSEAGRLPELEWGDDDAEGLALPPTAEVVPIGTATHVTRSFAYEVDPVVGELSAVESLDSLDRFIVREPLSDDHIEIDIEELGLGGHPRAPGGRESPEPVRVHALDASVESDPVGLRDAEIDHLRAQLAERDAEIARLRTELTKLREQYLDL